MSKREVRSKERPPKSRVLARAAGNGCGLGIDPTFSWLTMRILRPFSRDELSRTKDVYHVHATLAASMGINASPWDKSLSGSTNTTNTSHCLLAYPGIPCIIRQQHELGCRTFSECCSWRLHEDESFDQRRHTAGGQCAWR